MKYFFIEIGFFVSQSESLEDSFKNFNYSTLHLFVAEQLKQGWTAYKGFIHAKVSNPYVRKGLLITPSVVIIGTGLPLVIDHYSSLYLRDSISDKQTEIDYILAIKSSFYSDIEHSVRQIENLKRLPEIASEGYNIEKYKKDIDNINIKIQEKVYKLSNAERQLENLEALKGTSYTNYLLKSSSIAYAPDVVNQVFFNNDSSISESYQFLKNKQTLEKINSLVERNEHLSADLIPVQTIMDSYKQSYESLVQEQKQYTERGMHLKSEQLSKALSKKFDLTSSTLKSALVELELAKEKMMIDLIADHHSLDPKDPILRETIKNKTKLCKEMYNFKFEIQEKEKIEKSN
jgi:hypothetical protein